MLCEGSYIDCVGSRGHTIDCVCCVKVSYIGLCMLYKGAIQRYGSSGQLTGDESSSDTQPLVGSSSSLTSYTSPEENVHIEVKQPEAISFWRALQIPVHVAYTCVHQCTLTDGCTFIGT